MGLGQCTSGTVTYRAYGGGRVVRNGGNGGAVHEALRIALACPCNECGKDEWKSHISDAWAWLWGT
eukprot:2321889-Rhodomonas_salina.1